MGYMGFGFYGYEIMRRFLILTTLIMTVLSSCSILSNKQEVSMINSPKIEFDKIISALDNRDKQKLKSLFSQDSIAKTPNIDKEIDGLFEMYQGKFVSNSSFDSGGSMGNRENGKWISLFISPYIKELKTDKAVYELHFSSVPANYKFPEEVGLWRIILKLKDGDEVIEECVVGVGYGA